MKAIILAALVLLPQVAQAQTFKSIEISTRDIDSAIDQRCMSDLCEQAVRAIKDGEMGRQAAVVGNDVGACIKANSDFGGLISHYSFQASEGKTYDDGTEIRGRIYTNTYFVRSALRDIIRMGDKKQCEKLLQVGNSLILDTLKNY